MTNYNSFVYDTSVQLPKISNSYTVYFSIFFDGTLNNLKNVFARSVYEKYRDHEDGIGTKDERTAYEAYEKNKDDDSYQNDYSNVAHLFQYAIDVDYEKIPLYLEGPGSHKYDADDSFDGTALGRGCNGIRARVKEACLNISEKTNNTNIELKSTKRTVRRIIFDVYGFSRGAAAARNFIHEITQNRGLKEGYVPEHNHTVDKQIYFPVSDDVKPAGFLGYYLKKKGIDIKKIAIFIRFVGLFDTVSSYAPKYTLKPDFEDIKELDLHAVSRAFNIVHLTAADEHRKNFALTPIKTITREPKGKYAIEISLPGVHSDIGGGYRDKTSETKEVMDIDNCPEFENEASHIRGINKRDTRERQLEYERDKLIDEGWFSSLDECSISPGNGELIFTRKEISNQYSYIPLLLMHQFCKCYKMFKSKTLEINFAMPDTIDPKKGFIEAIVHDRTQLWLQGWNAHTSQNNDVHYWRNSLESDIKYLVNNNRELLSIDFYALKLAKEWFLNKDYKDIKQIHCKSSSEIISPYRTIQEIQENMDKIRTEIIEQIYLRHLRHDFLHWSSDFKGSIIGGVETFVMPHEPAPRYENGKRTREIVDK